jgi:hypothetical protein
LQFIITQQNAFQLKDKELQQEYLLHNITILRNNIVNQPYIPHPAGIIQTSFYIKPSEVKVSPSHAIQAQTHGSIHSYPQHHDLAAVTPVSILQENAWTPKPVWMGVERENVIIFKVTHSPYNSLVHTDLCTAAIQSLVSLLLRVSATDYGHLQ